MRTKSKKKTNIVGLKDLRTNTQEYISRVEKGSSFVVVRRSQPIFKITPVEDVSEWETVADFTKIKKGGVSVKDVLARL